MARGPALLALTLAALGALGASGPLGPARPPAAALRVLALFPVPAPSHHAMFRVLMEALLDRGHEVVSFSPFPGARPRANWTEVDISNSTPSWQGTFRLDEFAPSARWWQPPGWQLYEFMSRLSQLAGCGLCRQLFEQPAFAALLDGRYGRFDVVLTEVFSADCWAAVPHRLGVPVVGLSSAPDVAWLNDRLGNPDNPAYISHVLTDLRGRLTLWQRLQNTATYLATNYLFTRFMQDDCDAVVREFFGPDVPALRQLVQNTSLVLLNRHVSIHAARPVSPNLVHVGGLHVQRPPGALDAALRAWLDGAEHGVVFFSLGSLIRAASLPAAKRDALLAAFATLPQRVLWKYEDEALAVPPNVRVAKWLPQMDVLTHPKTVLFMTHGGLMGTLEALHSSVPLLGIPLFADQASNLELYQSLGIARVLQYADVSEEAVRAEVHAMTADTRYRRRAREVAALFRDRPRAALDEAVWWVEYVVRHRGAPHLRPLGADMPLHQYLLLDVAALAAALALAGVGALLALLALPRAARARLARPDAGNPAPPVQTKSKAV